MLSVIICTYNREKYIRPLLESLAANTLEKDQYEIVLVDNNCTDNTQQVCQQYTKEHADVMFRYVEETEHNEMVVFDTDTGLVQGDLVEIEFRALNGNTYTGRFQRKIC